jgi:hypothetical protein
MHSDSDSPWWADGTPLRTSAAASAEVALRFPAWVMDRLLTFARKHDLSIQEVVQLAVDFSLQSKKSGRPSR